MLFWWHKTIIEHENNQAEVKYDPRRIFLWNHNLLALENDQHAFN